MPVAAMFIISPLYFLRRDAFRFHADAIYTLLMSAAPIAYAAFIFSAAALEYTYAAVIAADGGC